VLNDRRGRDRELRDDPEGGVEVQQVGERERLAFDEGERRGRKPSRGRRNETVGGGRLVRVLAVAKVERLAPEDDLRREEGGGRFSGDREPAGDRGVVLRASLERPDRETLAARR
jgi:hypothetical protein